MPLPQIQFMPQANQVRERYIPAMKCGDVGKHTDFIYFLEECLKEPTWRLFIVGRVQAMTPFPLQEYRTKDFWMTPAS